MQGRPQTMLVVLRMLLLLVFVSVRNTFAHEVDHYNVPVGKQLVDHGPYWNQLLYDAVRKATESLNQDIFLAQKIPIGPIRTARLATLHHPSTVTLRVRRNLPSALLAIESLEMKFRQQRRAPQGDKIVAHRPSGFASTYGHLPTLPDPRQLSRMTLMRSSLIKVHGTNMGTDKIGHFIAMGYYYYLAYSSSRALGSEHDVALADARNVGVNGPISEHGVVGAIPTGIVSNGDLAANYVGMKFYLNLTQRVVLKGGNYPPMLIRDGDYWKLRSHVSRDGGFFSAFVSDHYDEALNPSRIEPLSRERIRRSIVGRREQVLAFYAGNDVEKMRPEYYDDVSRRLKTYYGEEYGHVGEDQALIQLANVLFPDRRAVSHTTPKSRDRAIALTVRGASHSQTGVDERLVITVTNLESSPVEGVSISMSLAVGITVVSVNEAAEIDKQRGNVEWRLRHLGPSETKTLRLRVRPKSSGLHITETMVKAAGQGTIAKSQHVCQVRDRNVEANVATGRSQTASRIPLPRIPTARR